MLEEMPLSHPLVHRMSIKVIFPHRGRNVYKTRGQIRVDPDRVMVREPWQATLKVGIVFDSGGSHHGGDLIFRHPVDQGALYGIAQAFQDWRVILSS